MHPCSSFPPCLLPLQKFLLPACAPAAPSSQILNVGERIIYGRTKDSTLPFSTSSPRIRFSSCWLVTGKYGRVSGSKIGLQETLNNLNLIFLRGSFILPASRLQILFRNDCSFRLYSKIYLIKNNIKYQERITLEKLWSQLNV